MKKKLCSKNVNKFESPSLRRIYHFCPFNFQNLQFRNKLIIEFSDWAEQSWAREIEKEEKKILELEKKLKLKMETKAARNSMIIKPTLAEERVSAV